MNFRTLIMLGLAALVIVVAIKMNRSQITESEEVPTGSIPDAVVEEPVAPQDSIMSEDEANQLIYDDMDGTVDVQDAPTDAYTTESEPALDTPKTDEPVWSDAQEPAEVLTDGPIAPTDATPKAPTDAENAY